MRIEVLLFAALREALGRSRFALDLPSQATAADLRARLAAEHPRFRQLIASCRLARGVDFIDESIPLADGDEVILVPPVSGGNAPSGVRLSRDPLDAEALRRAMHREGAGAVVMFEGTVRSRSNGRDVSHLEYEAYEPMALAMMTRIVAEAEERWPLEAIVLHHRLGRLEVGEVSVVAATSARRRSDAFAACRHLIERLKADVPIWKKECFADGSVWVGAERAGRVRDRG
jgi:molybdopterin synthase catalytic subunit